jgi:hypothetical protein
MIARLIALDQPPGQLLVEGDRADVGHCTVEAPNRGWGGKLRRQRAVRPFVGGLHGDRLCVAQGTD